MLRSPGTVPHSTPYWSSYPRIVPLAYEYTELHHYPFLLYMYVITSIVYCVSRRGASADAEVPADTGECRGSTAVRTIPGGSGDNVVRVPQTENQEVRSVL